MNISPLLACDNISPGFTDAVNTLAEAYPREILHRTAVIMGLFVYADILSDDERMMEAMFRSRGDFKGAISSLFHIWTKYERPEPITVRLQML